jgi:hypothetical protein
VLLVLSLGACGGKSGPTASIADAKCVSAIYDLLNVPDGVLLESQNVHVVHLSDGKLRVTAVVSSFGRNRVHGYDCVVSPDPSDKLRGLKIDSLKVSPSRW